MKYKDKFPGAKLLISSHSKATMLGVPGSMKHHVQGSKEEGCFDTQKFITEPRKCHVDGRPGTITANVRFDDQCGNRRPGFYITGNVMHGYEEGSGGCIHEELAKYFPELAHLIKWHGTFSDGPSGYIANTTYHAGDKDCWGLGKGEKRQIVNGRTKEPVWSLRADATGCKLKTPLGEDEDISNLPLYRLQDMLGAPETPTSVPRLFWQPCWKVGEGQERNLDAARRCAIWPEATDEQLCLPKEELAQLLEARLPELMARFKEDMLAAGFYWSPEDHPQFQTVFCKVGA